MKRKMVRHHRKRKSQRMSNSENTFFVQSREERSVTVYKRPKYYEVVKGFDTLNWFSIYSKIEVQGAQAKMAITKLAINKKFVIKQLKS